MGVIVIIKNKIYFIILLILVLVIAGSVIGSNHIQNTIRNAEGYVVDIDGSIRTFEITDDGVIILGKYNNMITAMKNDEVIWSHDMGGIITNISIAGEFAIASSDNREISVFSIENGLKHEFPLYHVPVTVDISPDGSTYLVGTSMGAMNNRLQLFDQYDRIWMEEHMVAFHEVGFMSDGESFFVVTGAGDLYAFSEDHIQIAMAALVHLPADAMYVCDEGLLFVLDERGKLYIFNEELQQLAFTNIESSARLLAYDSVGRLLLTASLEGLIEIYNLTGERELQISVPTEIARFRVSADANVLAILDNNGNILRFDWSILKGFSFLQSVNQALTIMIIVAIILIVICVLGLLLSIRKRKKGYGLLDVFLKHKKSYLLLFAPLSLLLIFFYYPAISGFVIAFMDYRPGIHMRWVGFDNFVSVFQNRFFWTGMQNMFVFLITDLIKALLPPLIIAELILAMRSKGAQYWSRVILFLPGVLPGVAVLLIWSQGILASDGVLNEILRLIGLGAFAQPWLASEQTAIWGLVMIGFPWVGPFLIFYGALISVPVSYFEAASLDGCSWLQRIIKIDIPCIIPQIRFVFIIHFIASIQDFGRVFLTTMGGPGHATYTPILELFLNMSRFNNYGVAAAMGLLMFIVIFVATLLLFRIRFSAEE